MSRTATGRRWTEEDLSRAGLVLQSQIRAPLTVKPSKYRNRRMRWQGHVFDSQHECQKFQEFELARIAGLIRAVVRQVSFQLPGCKRRIRIDFMIVNTDGSIRWVDAKGPITQTWALKSDQVHQAFGITIETV